MTAPPAPFWTDFSRTKVRTHLASRIRRLMEPQAMASSLPVRSNIWTGLVNADMLEGLSTSAAVDAVESAFGDFHSGMCVFLLSSFPLFLLSSFPRKRPN
jgi:hypothetical protein